MKVVLLCGGLGTRLSEETAVKPKPMVMIGDKPILWHIMNTYAQFGFNDFVLALGYKGVSIKEYFLNYQLLNSDSVVDLQTGKNEILRKKELDWRISLIDTGELTLTGGRLLRLKPLLSEGGTFMLTYGDGLSNINIAELLKFHKSHGKAATISAVRAPARFGRIAMDGNAVSDFREKSQALEGWINGGFFVFEPKVFDYLENDQTILEESPLQKLAFDNQLMAYKHEGFWQCMDTLRDKNYLESLLTKESVPWLSAEKAGESFAQS